MKQGINLHLIKLQAVYFLGAVVTLPFAPFLFLQGKYTRWKVGELPDAGGETRGIFGGGDELLKLLVIGESTVAGIGARTHEVAITGNLARYFSEKTGAQISWRALGESGITARRVTAELVPQIPDEEFNLVTIVLGGNDLFRLRPPIAWRRHWKELLDAICERQPRAKILIANVPRVKEFPAFPHPLKFVLWNLAKLQHSNMKDFLEDSPIVYFSAPGKFLLEDFSDGLHPSELGYARWAEAMVKFFFAVEEKSRISQTQRSDEKTKSRRAEISKFQMEE